MNIEKIHQLFLKFQTVCTDTRKIEPNCIFFCLKGDNFDANSFAEEALNKGAAFVIIDNEKFYQDEKTILVSNVLKTLQELANFHRNFLELPIIALTGSNGKTTSKELIQVVLSKKFTAKATIGNLNNHIGVPLTLLSFDESTEIGIVEMGANHQKEIEFLCTIAQPNFGYITNFGKAHLEGFGGVEGVIKGKSELYDYLKSNNQFVVVNENDPIQVEKTEGYDLVIPFGRRDSEFYFEKFTENNCVGIIYNEVEALSKLTGDYNFTNLCAATSLGLYFGIDFHLIKKAIEEYKKFMYLATTSNQMVSPSEIVDIVWHQHLIFTQSYTDFCALLGKKIQHIPSTHNKEEQDKFLTAKKHTTAIYESKFGKQPKLFWEYNSFAAALEIEKSKIFEAIKPFVDDNLIDEVFNNLNKK